MSAAHRMVDIRKAGIHSNQFVMAAVTKSISFSTILRFFLSISQMTSSYNAHDTSPQLHRDFSTYNKRRTFALYAILDICGNWSCGEHLMLYDRCCKRAQKRKKWKQLQLSLCISFRNNAPTYLFYCIYSTVTLYQFIISITRGGFINFTSSDYKYNINTHHTVYSENGIMID